MTPAPPAFRNDIEGLRGLAVLLVVAEHAFGYPLAGFIGVDVFFVISGFLITGLLIREWERRGQISLTAFYARRARRILPAAVVTIAATLAAAAAIWALPRLLATLQESFASGLFVMNWHLIAVGTDYLGAEGGTSPLQHFWSLAVEEQFYVFWPVLIIIVGLIARRLGASNRFALYVFVVCAAVMLVSAVYAAWRQSDAPTAAYFDSFARFWELSIGACVAAAAPAIARVPLWFRRGAALCGVTVILGTALFVQKELGAPWPTVIAPVVATAIVLAFGGAGTDRQLIALTNPVSRWFGRISYSFYLWHFPVIIFAASLGHTSVPASVTVVLLSIVLGALSHRYVEVPAQRSNLLRSWERPAPLASAPRRRWLTQQFSLATGIALLIGIGTAAQMRGPAQLTEPGALAATIGAPESHQTLSDRAIASHFGSDPSELADLIASSAQATTWPRDLTPSLDDTFPDKMAPAMGENGCRFEVNASEPLRLCDTGDKNAERTALVIGDSIALSWTPAIERALEPAGWRVKAIGFASCPAIDVDITLGDGSEEFTAACDVRRTQLYDLVASERPDLLILADSQRGYTQLASGAQGDAAFEEWADGTASAVQKYAAHAERVVVISNPPRGSSPNVCATRLTGPGNCTTHPDDSYTDKNGAEKQGVHEAIAAGANATHIDTRTWFCAADGSCPSHIGSILLRVDQWHLTEAAAIAFAPYMRQALAAP